MEIVRYKTGSRSAALDRIKSRSLQMNPELVGRVSVIVEDVRRCGDEALIRYTDEFDHIALDPSNIKVDTREIDRLASRADRDVLAAFRKAIANVRQFHEHQKERSWTRRGPDGSVVGQRIIPVSSAGLYVPGGRAAYPSSVIMNAVPAQVAGVRRIALVTPPGTLERNPMVAAVIRELEIDEVYRVGGAQAIAALAFGTRTIPRVDKIVGPGNAYVATAKKIVYGAVGIDSIAGPTEVVVVAGDQADPRFIAADLLAQAEHDEEASAICITTSEAVAQSVSRQVDLQLESLERRSIAGASIEKYGAVFVVDSIEEACSLVNELAPEHLELMTGDNRRAADLIENAGAIFFGAWSSEPVGDYFAGPNHVLPTVGTARFSSPLGVQDFLKRQSVIEFTRSALEKNAGDIGLMAGSEGLTGHRNAVLIRSEEGGAQSESISFEPDPLSKIKPAVRAITAYNLPPYRATTKINQNENPFDIPLEIKQEVERRLEGRVWARYPDFVPSGLLERLAAHSGWREDGILAGNGSNELIQAVLMVTVGQGTRVVLSEPTFTLYRQVITVLGGEVASVPLTADLQFDIPALERAREGADVLLLCSPNNPTGCVISDESIRRLASGFDGIVIIDEAYHEFARHTVVPLLDELDNLIVFRTFSKAMALAGLRIGYLLTRPELAVEVHKATLPYNLNFFTSTAAQVACERYDLLTPLVEKIISERERLQKELGAIPGLEPYPSAANFILLKTPIEPRRLFEELHARDILIRDVSRYPMLSSCVRVSVGAPEENDRLISALHDIFNSQS